MIAASYYPALVIDVALALSATLAVYFGYEADGSGEPAGRSRPGSPMPSVLLAALGIACCVFGILRPDVFSAIFAGSVFLG